MVDKRDKRIAKILGIKELEDIFDEALDVTEETLGMYFDYLIEHIEYPCQVSGIDYFGWERYYISGPGNKNEYEELKKNQPLHTDTFNLLSFEEVDPDLGILITVERVSDKKDFTLPLAELKTTEKKSKNQRLLDDYAYWFVNYTR